MILNYVASFLCMFACIQHETLDHLSGGECVFHAATATMFNSTCKAEVDLKGSVNEEGGKYGVDHGHKRI